MPGALTAVLLCFAGLTLFGSDRAELALIMDALWGVVLLVALWRRPVRFNLFQVRTLHLIGGLFIALMTWIALSLTPLAPEPPGGVWSWVGVSAGTIDKAMTLVELTKLIGLAAAFCTGVLLADTDRRAELTLRTLCVAGALFALFALLQHVITPTRVLGAAKILFADRLTGTFLSANIAAGFFGGIALLNLATLDAGQQVHASRIEGDVRFILRYGALILIFACLVLTASRLGALAVMAGLAVSLGLSLFKERDAAISLRSQTTSRLVVSGVFLLLAVAGQLLISRFGEVDGGLNGRSVLFTEHVQAFLASPLTGYGLGSFTAVNDQLVTPENFYAMWNIRAAHNVYLQWLEETGVVGALLMFSVIGLIHWEIFQGLRSRQSMGWLMRGVLGCSTVLLVQGFGDFTLQTPAIALMWALLLGLGYRVAIGGGRAVARESQTASSSIQRAAFWIPVGVALVAELCALLVLWGAGRKAAEDGFPLALRTAYEQAALHGLATGGPAGRQAARSYALAAVRQSPTDAYAWTLLAYIDGNSALGTDALEKSYLSAPMSPNLVRWRTQMVANRWDQLTPELRAKVMQELRIERKLEGFDIWLKGLLARHRDTSFGLALSLALQNWDSNSD
jgi:O-antigen ligase